MPHTTLGNFKPERDHDPHSSIDLQSGKADVLTWMTSSILSFSKNSTNICIFLFLKTFAETQQQ